MPYKTYTTTREGKKKFCMRNIKTGKSYCYNSSVARKKGMRIHEMFKHMPKSKIRIAKK